MRKLSPWTLVVAGAIALHVIVLLSLGFEPFDDAFITFRYAHNLAHGHGLVFNASDDVLGTTAPLWACVLALALWVGLPVAGTTLAIGAAANSVSAVLVYKLLKLHEVRPVFASLAVVALLSYMDFMSLARSGMEAAPFVSVLLAGIYFTSLGRLGPALVFAVLAPFLRPEGALLTLFVLGWAVCRIVNNSSRRRGIFLLGAALIALAVPLVVITIVYGSPLPQSVRSKASLSTRDPMVSWRELTQYFTVGQWGAGYMARTASQLNFVMSTMAAAGLYVVMRAAVVERKFRDVLAFAAWPVVFAAGYATAGAFLYYPWYYAPLYPFVAMLALVAADRLTTLAASRRPDGGGTLEVVRRATVVTVVVVAVFMSAQIYSFATVKVTAARHDVWVEDLAVVTDVIPADAHTDIAALEIGVIAWNHPSARMHDLMGLVTPEVVSEGRMPYLKRVMPSYLSFRVDDGYGSGLLPFKAEDADFWNSYQLVNEVDDPRKRNGYCLYEKKSERAFGNSSHSDPSATNLGLCPTTSS